MDLRRGKNVAKQLRERGDRKSLRSNPADNEDREGMGGGAPGTKAEMLDHASCIIMHNEANCAPAAQGGSHQKRYLCCSR